MRRDELERRRIATIEVPLPLYGWGVIDTAAEKSGVGAATAQALLVNPIGTNRVRTPGGPPVMRPVYGITLTVGPSLDRPPDPLDLDVVEVDIEGAAMLIGRDVLGFGELSWRGAHREFELRLPRSGQPSG